MDYNNYETQPTESAGNNDKNARMWGMLCHLSALSLYIGIPFGNIIGPVLIWQIKKEEFPILDEHGKAVLNFQLSMIIYIAISFLLSFVIIGIVFLLILGVLNLVFTIIGSIKANEGTVYSYPLTIKIIK